MSSRKSCILSCALSSTSVNLSDAAVYLNRLDCAPFAPCVLEGWSVANSALPSAEVVSYFLPPMVTAVPMPPISMSAANFSRVRL